jgi:hypothetical protein
MELEKVARKYVQDLKHLYVNVSVYAVVLVVSILVWLSLGGAGFWPIWVLLAFVAAAVLQGWTIGSLKQLEELLPFLKPEWEEKQLKKLLKNPSPIKAHGEKAAYTTHHSSHKEEAVSSARREEHSTAHHKKESHSHAPSRAATSKKTTSSKTPSKKKPIK